MAHSCSTKLQPDTSSAGSAIDDLSGAWCEFGVAFVIILMSDGSSDVSLQIGFVQGGIHGYLVSFVNGIHGCWRVVGVFARCRVQRRIYGRSGMCHVPLVISNQGCVIHTP